MIRNIVFDLGNVLLSWKPADYLIKSGYDQDKAKKTAAAVFESEAWKRLDNGDISENEAINLISDSSSLKRPEIASLFKSCRQIIYSLEKNIKLLPVLKKQAFKLYYLSNFPLDFFYEIKGRYDFLDYFDGGIISAEVRLSKPDPEIFRLFLDRYELVSEECLYIDDISSNAKSAEEIGMKVIHLEETDSLESKLVESGIDIKIASSPAES
jgi:putative hydrolase of the HAD superfamily